MCDAEAAYEEGHRDGYNEGYDDGCENAYADGYDQGYDACLADTKQEPNALEAALNSNAFKYLQPVQVVWDAAFKRWVLTQGDITVLVPKEEL